MESDRLKPIVSRGVAVQEIIRLDAWRWSAGCGLVRWAVDRLERYAVDRVKRVCG